VKAMLALLRSLATRLLLAPIGFYRRFLSPLKGQPTCRFLPTCSEYAIEAITRRGPLVGTAMSISRILRCNPLFVGGYHPVAAASVKAEHSDCCDHVKGH
jgi:uncharacterized protein